MSTAHLFAIFAELPHLLPLFWGQLAAQGQQVTCVGAEIVADEIAFEAWQLIGEVLSATTVALGAAALDLTMPCRHDPKAVQVKKFSQRESFLSVDGVDLEEDAKKWVAEKKRREDAAS